MKRQLPLLFLDKIMIAKQDIIKALEPKIKEVGGFLVDVKVNTANVPAIAPSSGLIRALRNGENSFIRSSVV